MSVRINAVAMPLKGKKIFVGLSGGVDSGVTAARLQGAGALVTGVFIKGWYPPGMPCTWSSDRRDAMRVAAHLRIPFLTLDASKEYKEGVIDYLLREYKAGNTPNPDIMCNREVKFGAFARYAEEQGADFIATGHYAQSVLQDDKVHLYRGIDESKDQSYFLWAVSKDSLTRTLFPLGGIHKSQVRKLALRYGLPNARKKDSQGICFLGSISVEEFLEQEFGSSPGYAVDTEGNTIGMHTGALLHTLGERVSITNAPPGPWYVVRKDIDRNELIVSHSHVEYDIHKSTDFNGTMGISLLETNLFSMPLPEEKITAQYRYHGPRIPGTYVNNTFTASATIPESIASGQSLVLYQGDECIGGGIIA